MRDWLIGILLKQNLSGWRAKAFMLKQSEESGQSYLASTPSLEIALKNETDTALLDTFASSFQELSKRAARREELRAHMAHWLCADGGDPRPALASLEEHVSSKLKL